MLHRVAFATSLTILSAGLYLLFYIFAVIAPQAFRFVFNAQFLGADVASLLPRQLSYGGFLGTLIALAVSAWLIGYVWAWLYNWLRTLFGPSS